MKKVLLVTIMFVLCLTLTGCKEKNVEGSLEEIMTKVYSTLKQDETPMMLTNIQITEENVEAYLGTTDIKFKEALASESATGSIAHSVVLIRVDEKTNVEQVKEKIENSVNPRKWICVEAEEVEVESKGNLILLVMSNEKTVEKITEQFEKLK